MEHIHPRGYAGPDWITVLRVVTGLPPDARVERYRFEWTGALGHWHWAVRERNEGQVDGRRRDSPWRAFAIGQPASLVRDTLAAWAVIYGLEPVPATEIAMRMQGPEDVDECTYWTSLWSRLVVDPGCLRRQEQSLVFAAPTIGSIDALLSSLEAQRALRNGADGATSPTPSRQRIRG